MGGWPNNDQSEYLHGGSLLTPSVGRWIGAPKAEVSPTAPISAHFIDQ